MLTYDDLQKCPTEEARQNFILSVIAEHMSSDEYRIAADAELYYKHQNPTINRVKKFIRDLNGQTHIDDVSPNNRIASDFYNFFVTQTVQYILGNGVTFENGDIKEQLGGTQFDNMLQLALKNASNAGVSYALFLDGKIQEVFKFAGGISDPDFAPLLSEEDGTVRGGIRYWQIDSTKPRHITLFEETQYTEYIVTDGEWEITTPTRPYTRKITRESSLEGAPETITAANENNLCPIVPLYYINRQSALVGNQATIDAYDQTLSELVNGTQDDFVYWIFQNCAGMDEIDAEIALRRLRENHFGWADSVGENSAIDFKTVQSPYEPKVATLNQLEERLYTDFKAFNPMSIGGGNRTATEIQSAYQRLDSKCDEVEDCLIVFIRQILRVAGLDPDESFHFTRSKVINVAEDINSVISSAQFIGEDATTRKLCELLGMGDEYETIQEQKAASELAYFTAQQASTQSTGM